MMSSEIAGGGGATIGHAGAVDDLGCDCSAARSAAKASAMGGSTGGGAGGAVTATGRDGGGGAFVFHACDGAETCVPFDGSDENQSTVSATA